MEAFALEPTDKKIISDIIKENMEATKKWNANYLVTPLASNFSVPLTPACAAFCAPAGPASTPLLAICCLISFASLGSFLAAAMMGSSLIG